MSVVKHDLITHSKSLYEDHWAIRIQEGEYQGVVFQYDTVSLDEPLEGEDVYLHFNTIELENPNNKDLTSDDFKDTVGDLLVSIIGEHLETIDESSDN